MSKSANYYLVLNNVNMTIYIKDDNMKNQEARVYLSDLKNKALLSNHSLIIEIRARS
jgi:iron complex outermembrane receptor protein